MTTSPTLSRPRIEELDLLGRRELAPLLYPYPQGFSQGMDGGYQYLDRWHPRLQYQRRFLLDHSALLFFCLIGFNFATFSPLTTVGSKLEN